MNAPGDDGDLLESLASRRAVILHALDTVDILIEACGDFLSSKVSEDLWPLLKVCSDIDGDAGKITRGI